MAEGRAACLLTAALLCGACPANPERLQVGSVAVEGTSFRIAATDGRVLRSSDLVGAVLGVRLHGSEQRIRIGAVRADPVDPTLLLHSIFVERADGGWRPLCKVAPDGKRDAYPISGRAMPDGTLAQARQGDVEIVCTSGAQGKCLRLGYRPWSKLADGSTMLRVFNACVRMMRADYSGRGQAATRDGTLVEVFDTIGLRPIGSHDLRNFEAGWDEKGAVCVRHPRLRAAASLAQIESSSPRLKGRVGSRCTPERAMALGAVILNGSAS